jgi:Ankyrin repeats (many copies)
MWAARAGAIEAMTALLDAGADANARDRRNHWTPLLHAIHCRRLEAARLLLERGADPNLRTESVTPLLMAAVEPDPGFVKLLLSYGADPRARGIGGTTALSQAVSGGALSDIDRPLLGGCRTETVRALKTHDPDVDMPETIAGWHALWWARFHGCQDVLDLVVPVDKKLGDSRRCLPNSGASGFREASTDPAGPTTPRRRSSLDCARDDPERSRRVGVP